MDLKWRHFSISSHFIQQDILSISPSHIGHKLDIWILSQWLVIQFLHRPNISPRCLKSLRGSKWNPNWRLEKSLAQRWWWPTHGHGACLTMGSHYDSVSFRWKKWMMNFIGCGGTLFSDKLTFFMAFYGIKKIWNTSYFAVNYRVLLGFSSIPGSSLRNKPPSFVLLS